MGAQFVVSIDLEMSWGAVHHGKPHDDRPYLREREVVEDVLGLMANHGISATWAVVGHLFLASCGGEGISPHPEIEPPRYGWLDGDWYDLDPRGTVADNPTWYGPDLVAAIRQCSTPQEIGSHSFAHIIAGDPECSREAFAADVAAAQAVATAAGLDLKSFVYPRNSIGHVDVLEDAGFTNYRRSASPPFRAGLSGLPGRILHKVRPRAAPSPSRHGSMVSIPHTYLFDPDSKNARRLGDAAWSRLVQSRLLHAIRNESLFHLWFHTHNLATNQDRAHRAMDELFGLARREIDAGRLRNSTMEELAEQWKAQVPA